MTVLDVRKGGTMSKTIKRVLVLVLIPAVVGCTTATRIHYQSPDELQAMIEVGDTVKVTTVDGERIKTKVVEITDREIVGEDVSIPITDIEKIEEVELSKGKTAALAGGSALTITVLVLVGLAIAGLAAALANSE